MMAALHAAQNGHAVLLLEKLVFVGAKLKATGGGRCNLSNTLDNQSFMARFGKHGRFMTQALEALDYHDLQKFFASIGVPTHIPDGFRIFPVTHNASTVVHAMKQALETLHVTVYTHARATKLLTYEGKIEGVQTQEETFYAPRVILSTGGLGYPALGAQGDGYEMAKALGHTTTALYPAMMPLTVKESWVARCKADTIPKATLQVALPKAKHLKAVGDVIFTKNGIRGPVVLDFAREVTPLLEAYTEVPLLLNLTGGMHEDAILNHFKQTLKTNPHLSTLELVKTLLPDALSEVLCEQALIEQDKSWSKQATAHKTKLVALLAHTPLTVTGHEGFKMAMITRGGISLKEIDPKTMQSRLIAGLYFCGEIMDLDGPCGGYNLQWSFASGYLAGALLG